MATIKSLEADVVDIRRQLAEFADLLEDDDHAS